MTIMAGKSLTSINHATHILMLDMRKAFDTVNRSILIQELSKFLEKDEVHLISILLKTNLIVRCGNHTSKPFKTNTGVSQGDSLSANQFTFFLANELLK